MSMRLACQRIMQVRLHESAQQQALSAQRAERLNSLIL
jgi:hypothetical protein